MEEKGELCRPYIMWEKDEEEVGSTSIIYSRYHHNSLPVDKKEIIDILKRQ